MNSPTNEEPFDLTEEDARYWANVHSWNVAAAYCLVVGGECPGKHCEEKRYLTEEAQAEAHKFLQELAVFNGPLWDRQITREHEMFKGSPQWWIELCDKARIKVPSILRRCVAGADTEASNQPPENQPISGVDRNKPNVTVHKMRRNSIDAPIEKAIELAGNRQTADVWVQLKELALNQMPPLLGIAENGAIEYTGENKRELLTKNALSKRLKRQ